MSQTNCRNLLFVIAMRNVSHLILIHINGICEVVPIHAIKTCKGSGDIAPLIRILSTRLGSVVSLRPRPLPRGKGAPITHWRGGWVDPRAGVDVLETRHIICPCWDSNPGFSRSWPSRRTEWSVTVPLANSRDKNLGRHWWKIWMFTIGQNLNKVIPRLTSDPANEFFG